MLRSTFALIPRTSPPALFRPSSRRLCRTSRPRSPTLAMPSPSASEPPANERTVNDAPASSIRSVQDLRVHYSATSLDASSFRPDPIEQFSLWFAEATSAFAAVGPTAGEANAMCLATSTPSGIPSARMVLLKGYSRAGFVWYTHYGSRKGAELASNPRAAAVFWWPPLERSVRIEGVVERLSDAENDEYFARRPAISRLGAAASEQSRPVDSREAMTDRWDALCAKHLDEDGNVVEEIRRPEGWGGYRLSPSRMEFWKGREARMHDRIEYEREGDRWSMRRLQP